MISRELCHFLHRLTLYSQLRIPDTVPRVLSNISFCEAATLHPILQFLECSVLRYCSMHNLLSPSRSRGRSAVLVDIPSVTHCSLQIVLYPALPDSLLYFLRFSNIARLRTCYMGHCRDLKLEVSDSVAHESHSRSAAGLELVFSYLVELGSETSL